MRSETIRKNLESTIQVTWTELPSREDKIEEFGSTEIAEAIMFARNIEQELGKDNIIYLAVELILINKSEQEGNVVFRQDLPYNI